MTTSLSLNSIPSPSFLEVPEPFHSQRFSIFWPSRFPSHEALFPVVKILKPGRDCLLFRAIESSSANMRWASSLEDDVEEEDGLCPVDCVKEFKTEKEFSRILEKAKGTNSLVVVDFYRTSCGSCKYIEQGFVKLCKGSGDDKDSVVFLKHNEIQLLGMTDRLPFTYLRRAGDRYLMNMMNSLRLLKDCASRQCHNFSSTKMGFFWKHLQPETKRGS